MFIGQGSPEQARWFRQQYLANLEVRILCDPSLVTFRAAEMKGDWWRCLHPLVAWRVLLAFWRGYRQGPLQGTPFQNGGVMVANQAGITLYCYRAAYPGDSPRGWELARLKSALKKTGLR